MSIFTGFVFYKAKQNRILISLQSTSCCLNASLSVITEKSADNNHTQTGKHFSQVQAHSHCVFERMWVSARGFIAQVRWECVQGNIHCVRNPEQSSQSDRNWFQTHFQDIMFNNQKQAIFNDYMAFFSCQTWNRMWKTKEL